MDLKLYGLHPGLYSGGRVKPERRRIAPPAGLPPHGEEHGREPPPDGGHTAHRGAIIALNLAIQEAEQASAILAAAEAGLGAAEAVLAGLVERLRAGPAPPDAAEARPSWLVEALDQLAAVAERTRFGHQRLLDGSLGCTGAAVGEALTFVRADDTCHGSPPEGYAVRVTRAPTPATLVGDVPLTAVPPDEALVLDLREGRGAAHYAAPPGETPEAVAARLQEAVRARGLALAVSADEAARLVVQHRRRGAGHRFMAQSSVPGVLSTLDGQPRLVANGEDIAGTLADFPAEGQGSVLVGTGPDGPVTGLTVRYLGPPVPAPHRPWEPGTLVGRVLVARRAFTVQPEGDGARALRIRLDGVQPTALGRAADTACGFASLADVRLDEPLAWADARGMAEAALAEVRDQRETLRAEGRHEIEGSLARLRVKAQNLCAVRPVGTPDALLESVRGLSRRIRAEAREALSAQEPATAGTVLGLLRDNE